MTVCGNHEADGEIPPHFLFHKARQSVQMLELEDLVIVGIDDSRLEVSDRQNQLLLDILKTGKPVIVALHVPIRTEDNAAILDKCGDYFKLNNENASPSTLNFIDILKCLAGQIIAVLAGHLHFGLNSRITPELMQFVSSQGILGNINRYEIGV